MDKDVLEFTKIEEQTTQFKYQLRCQGPKDKNKMKYPHRYKVTLKQQNLLTRQLLRPAVHTVAIEIHCGPPATERLFWAQNSTDIVPYQRRHLPRYKIINEERTHYVLVNSRHFIRYLFFDNSEFVFFNSSSI